MAQGIALERATGIPPGPHGTSSASSSKSSTASTSFGENLEAESEEYKDKCLNAHDGRDARKVGFEDGRMKSWYGRVMGRYACKCRCVSNGCKS